MPFWMFILLFIVLFCQAAWIFNDASKRGENKWIWGFFGLLNVPTNLIVYLIVTRCFAKSIPCKTCGKKIKNDFKFCPHCGDINNGYKK
ncbi:MAG: zinc ribbon domain-containing protein [Bacillota bacterium]|nr:zinc ribbon domain-containing protein [Bacillota bacterium]